MMKIVIANAILVDPNTIDVNVHEAHPYRVSRIFVLASSSSFCRWWVFAKRCLSAFQANKKRFESSLKTKRSTNKKWIPNSMTKRWEHFFIERYSRVKKGFDCPEHMQVPYSQERQPNSYIPSQSKAVTPTKRRLQFSCFLSSPSMTSKHLQSFTVHGVDGKLCTARHIMRKQTNCNANWMKIETTTTTTKTKCKVKTRRTNCSIKC